MKMFEGLRYAAVRGMWIVLTGSLPMVSSVDKIKRVLCCLCSWEDCFFSKILI